eukprot:CAMPEP_0167753140 /NCGR_PEP_ID=MMETSP0110_2-20121227/7541_1 /TAXON_ID=629695 /ORGANISM="Gymnochlora sp., Strain CCMP2014" /LENGTH=224 /DNA_ID=CAMNT_0007638859 /DNA_START=37 /DNA_END=712 /DNA_ORIENTATION=+
MAKLLVSNISTLVNAQHLRELFNEFGELISVSECKKEGEAQTCIVEFKNVEDAKEALALSGTDLGDRTFEVKIIEDDSEKKEGSKKDGDEDKKKEDSKKPENKSKREDDDDDDSDSDGDEDQDAEGKVHVNVVAVEEVGAVGEDVDVAAEVEKGIAGGVIEIVEEGVVDEIQVLMMMNNIADKKTVERKRTSIQRQPSSGMDFNGTIYLLANHKEWRIDLWPLR